MARPAGTYQIHPPQDVYLTLDRWPKEAFDTHFHDRFNWLIPMGAAADAEARMTVEVKGQSVRLGAGEWICLFPNVPHAVRDVTPGLEVMSLFLPVKEGMEALPRLSNTEAEDLRVRGYIRAGSPEIAQGLALQWALYRVEASQPAVGEEKRLFTQFLFQWMWRHGLNRAAAMEDEGGLRVALVQAVPELGSRLAEEITRYLGENPFPWEVVGNRLGMSTRTLQRRLKDALGRRPTDILTDFRMEEARRALAQPGVEVTHVALACGFQSLSHFSTLFRARYGESPREYRGRVARTKVPGAAPEAR